MVGSSDSATSLPARPPAIAPTTPATAPTTRPAGPATAPARAAPTPVPTGCAPPAPVRGSRLLIARRSIRESVMGASWDVAGAATCCTPDTAGCIQLRQAAAAAPFPDAATARLQKAPLRVGRGL